MNQSRVPAEWPDARLVIVDDEAPIRRMVEQLLKSTGYTDIHAFADPQEAIARIAALDPDLVLLDLHMPGMHGTDVLRELHEAVPERRVPVIVMTGGGGPEDVHRTLALGAVDFLHKPVEPTELLLRVRHQLRERQLRQELAEQNRQLEDLAAARAGELALLSRVLDDIPVIAAVLEPDLRLRYANALARQLLQRDPCDLVGVFAPDPTSADELADFLTSSTAGEPIRRRWSLRAPGEPSRRVEIEAQRVDDQLIAVLVHDIEERERATDALRRGLELEQRANVDLREAEELRTHFLSAVSHELRTPLTVVLGMAESLERHHERLGVDEQLELVTRLHRNAQRLGRLLEDLLDLSRLVVGQLRVRPSTSDLAGIVEEAVAELELRHHPVVVDVPPTQIEVEWSRIQRVIANLVRNATVHTPVGTPVRVELVDRGESVQLRVVDRGPGVADELKERIFRPFEQGPSAPKHQPGTGIGLSLVREFVRLHNGRSWVEDTPGGGATFVVELPREVPG